MRALHIVPENKTGGVELTVSVLVKKSSSIDLLFIRENSNFLSGYFWSALKMQHYDRLVFSLWKSVPLLLICRLVFPKKRVCYFLHSQRDAHVIDWLLTRAAIIFSHEIFLDAESTAARSDLVQRKPHRVINMLGGMAHRFSRENVGSVEAPREPLRFVFWGRLHKDKAIERQLKLVAEIKKLAPCKLNIIGPDEGEKPGLEKLAKQLNIQEAVDFCGPKTFFQISQIAGRCSFFLMTSHREGRALSVLEAMSLGVIPVVRPVGEIGSYCQDSKNAIFITDDFSVSASRIVEIASNKSLVQKLQENAVLTFWDEVERGVEYEDAVTGI